MFGRMLVLILLALPLVEIALFIVIGRSIGVVPTLLGVLLSAIVGSALIRRQGLSLLTDIRAEIERGQLPARRVADVALVALAGALLIVPGYFTSLVGVLLLVPAVRSLLYRLVARRMRIVTSAPAPREGPEYIDLDRTDWRDR